MDSCCYAIIPDGESHPTALFHDLEEAMAWALKKYGGNRFTIRHVDHLRRRPTRSEN